VLRDFLSPQTGCSPPACLGKTELLRCQPLATAAKKPSQLPPSQRSRVWSYLDRILANDVKFEGSGHGYQDGRVSNPVPVVVDTRINRIWYQATKQSRVKP
jgi:hypothetical protein